MCYSFICMGCMENNRRINSGLLNSSHHILLSAPSRLIVIMQSFLRLHYIIEQQPTFSCRPLSSKVKGNSMTDNKCPMNGGKMGLNPAVKQRQHRHVINSHHSSHLIMNCCVVFLFFLTSYHYYINSSPFG